MAIVKRKNGDEDKSKPSSKRSRMVSGENEGTSDQSEHEMDGWRESNSKHTEKEPNVGEITAQLADNDQGSVMPPRESPYVNAIQRRDIASFLPREKVEQWRLTSQFSDAAISEFPSKLPFRRYRKLEIATWSGVRKLGKDGYVDSAQGSPYGKGKGFQTIFDFRFCCKGFEGSAQMLAGEMIFPGKREDDVVIFRFTPGVRNRQACLRILNRLTEKTAFGFLHFVWHAGRNCCYESFNFDLGELASAEEGAMNPRVLHTIKRELALEKPFRFRALNINKVALYYGQVPLDWSEERVGAAQRLFTCKKATYHHYWNQPTLMSQRMLRFFGTAGRLAPVAEICFMGWQAQAAGLIDPLIQCFRDLTEGLKSSIADIRFYTPYVLAGWPTLCPKNQAVSNNGHIYEFQFKNTATEKGFKVALRQVQWGLEGVADMHLTIDR